MAQKQKNKNIFVGEGVVFQDTIRAKGACTIQVNGKDLTDPLYLLSVSGSGAVNVQLDVNFDNALFVTVFGDKLTPLTFKGVVVPGLCSGRENGSGNSIVSFYNKYKVGAKKGKADVITVSYNKGDFVFKGILTGMSLNPYTQSGPNAFTFSVTIMGRVSGKSVST